MKRLLESLLTIFLFFSVGTCLNVNAEGMPTKYMSEIVLGDGGRIDENVNIILDKNYSFDWLGVAVGYTVTIDLNGHDLEITGDNEALFSWGTLLIKDSTATKEPTVLGTEVTYKSGKIKGDVIAAEGGGITLQSGTIEAKKLGLVAEGNRTEDGEPWYSAVTVDGGYVLNENGCYALFAYGNGAKLIVNDGVFKATDNAVVGGNGDYGGTSIYIKGGKFIGQTSTDGDVACGVYHPQNGTLEIVGGEFYIYGGVGVLARSGKTTISGDTKIMVSGRDKGKVGSSNRVVPTVAVYNDVNANYPGGAPSIDISGGLYSNDVSEYLVNGYKVIKSDDKDGYEVIASDTTSYEVVNNELAIDEIAANSIDKFVNDTEESPFNKNDEIIVSSYILGLGDKYEINHEEYDFSELWNGSDEKVELTKVLNTQENVSEVIPLAVVLRGTDASWNSADIQTLTTPANVTLFLNDETLAKVNGKQYTLYRIYNDEEGFSVTSMTDEKTSLVGNAIPFSSDKFTCIYAIVTYAEPTSTPEAKKASAGWDDGGPFTTDTCGNVFDRWGNKIYEAKGCNVSGYNLVRTSVED